MSEEILINASAYETRVAIVRQGQLQELMIERAANRGLVGHVFLGKVVRVLPGMQSAFVDIGLERSAFLHVADLWQARQAGARQELRDAPTLAAIEIGKVLHAGQTLLVQVIKDPLGSKGARLSTQISIPGRLLVYLPQQSRIGVSARIDQAEERDALRLRVERLSAAEESGGFIVRSSADTASDDELAHDMRYLRRRWAEILDALRTSPAPALIYAELHLSQRCLRDQAGEHTVQIRVDSLQEEAQLRNFARAYVPGVADRITHHNTDRPIFDLYGIEDEISRALERRVDLKSGGYLIIDQTEALTSIDVNTGSFVGGRNFDDTIFRTNLEASHAIARQMRLRNLGGILVVDFIDMQQAQHRETVLAELRKALASDRARTHVHGFTALGLVEMTRKRTRESLARVLCEPCGVCEGTGATKTTQTICYDILREIRREAIQFNPNAFRIVASAEVIERFLDEESSHLASLSEAIGKPVSLAVEANCRPESFDIVLM